ncbi:hypothetical protein [Mycolicibacterium llatzerense]|uniref:hypothetical protein n=1 Tax=Mycolicibacterium llatzerense TaxID=280871 RepID=UPI0008DD5058|nr:hypothetical protein [Mycolicibacterium llatzerense]
MPIRLNPTDPNAASVAETELPGAGRLLATLATEATEALAALPAAAGVQETLDAFIAYRRAQVKPRRVEDRIILLIHRAGASPHAIGNALGINPQTITRRIEAAIAEGD